MISPTTTAAKDVNNTDPAIVSFITPTTGWWLGSSLSQVYSIALFIISATNTIDIETTDDVILEIAKKLKINRRDVGYAGLKD